MNSIDRQVIEQDNIREKYFHDLIIKNDNIKSDLLSILNLPDDLTKLNLIHEDKYINGITADFTLVYNNQIRAIIECKAGDIGVTDYVRGIGQVLQYEYFNEQNISSKGIQYSNLFNSILLVPSSAFNNTNFNIGKFKYPKSTYIVEINDSNQVARRISDEELKTLSTIENNSLTSISQYYIRDTRLFEIYMLLRYLCFLKIKNVSNVKRTVIELEIKKTNSINNNNWRNAWISLSSLGLINSNNLPTKSGLEFGLLDFEDFLIMMYKSYIKPYVETLLNYFTQSNQNINQDLKTIRSEIVSQFSNRDVLFLTQSGTRYLSSWLNILRDDFGCIDFRPRNSNRIINYNPLEMNDVSLKDNIVKYTKSKPYINNLTNIL
ncbi:hypothetical protein [Riemerella anatipestifer]|uniref:hypothetical protein n=1 Tax=Riemerella anatipestifer TaxID=34085 RepID=UPI0007ED9E83|nr:hypothetical protein [Riemerella anatipestifer]MCW0511463.1 hypothetical protein [Riemerella anatipestifer]MCW0519949.1 hypothetical protein [Riemerella anatipestifer]MDY3315710.1 hypothetical protein [Riemerella anatipestifer]MDY3391195.1 hypothetical protein [Riemerella anatipestifer]MDY3519223.1 hypothetical protein [Riemerella anatipestifer]